MARIKYVGLKVRGSTLFAETTGITWFPGDVNEIEDPQVVERMLKHPDVFALAEVGKPAPALSQVAPAPTPAPTAPADPAAPILAPGATVAPAADPLAGLDDAGVRAYAKAQGLKIVGIALMKGANLRAKVKAALDAKK